MGREPVPAVDGPGGEESRQPAGVAVETVVRLLAPDASGVPVRCGLHYDPGDPYAVQVRFFLDRRRREAVLWSFARELLAAGLHEPSGLGDVRVWPWRTTQGDAVALALSSPDGQALLEAPRATVAAFLEDTYAQVPRGRESERLDIDADAWLSGQLLPEPDQADPDLDQDGR
ncbi:Streptomyces sporulation and cell division protein, SsgA [Asanoa hainanensis]|uniref:Streptomyces sporulation and cell division protein, SsgA n=1 Tax=Asanoa hainanensis TaxID=560556 RepID=A0A239KB44_9ACTN|nr:SsgA family sporulation/cell division regulator [Asanoa hainanensis]SNT15275.1 Streptomyces sporulation and cell division protein, SsgA [Asanoa hainanensis]